MLLILLRSFAKITDWLYFALGESPSLDFRFLPVYSYGFFVAIGFLVGAQIATIELRRREKLGLLTGNESEITVGEGITPFELVFYFLFGFVLGFKIIGFFSYFTELSTYILPLKEYMLSMSHGSWIGGILVGAGLCYYYYYAKNKEKLPQPIKKKITIFPSDTMGDLVVIAAVLGVLGSNLFNYFEDPSDYETFWQDPVGSLFSGLSIYGGLICAAIGFAIYARIKKFNLLHFFDCIAPAFIVANGIGRLGCQVSGDGDWGVANLHAKPSFIPQFLWSSHYEHNIIDADPHNYIPGCVEEHCHLLSQAAYPTPIYEFLMCLVIFAILWGIRKRFTNRPGIVVTAFMVLIGLQRYSIEQLRDIGERELTYLFGIGFRQSELISIVLFVGGIVGTIYLWRYYQRKGAEIKKENS
ncbi:MAG: prolipoprotein diacylglyceryl transferase [Bacteroidetes bacterium]|nr:prolipoprotein diacylglyceryl transferase [Bacteroidota bacterium]